MSNSGLLSSNNLKIVFLQLNTMHEKSQFLNDSEVGEDTGREWFAGEPKECLARGRNGQSARSRLATIVAPRRIRQYGCKRVDPSYFAY